MCARSNLTNFEKNKTEKTFSPRPRVNFPLDILRYSGILLDTQEYSEIPWNTQRYTIVPSDLPYDLPFPQKLLILHFIQNWRRRIIFLSFCLLLHFCLLLQFWQKFFIELAFLWPLVTSTRGQKQRAADIIFYLSNYLQQTGTYILKWIPK